MSGPLDFVTRPVRSLLGVESSALREVGEVEEELKNAVQAIHRAAESMERHVAVIDSLATSVPALTESVNALVRELNGLLAVLAPVAATERDVSRLGHLFGHRHVAGGMSTAETQVPTEAPADPDPT